MMFIEKKRNITYPANLLPPHVLRPQEQQLDHLGVRPRVIVGKDGGGLAGAGARPDAERVAAGPAEEEMGATSGSEPEAEARRRRGGERRQGQWQKKGQGWCARW